MDARRAAEAKGPRKEATEIKRLAKFYAVDRPPRKRLRTLLDFLKNPSSGAGTEGNLVGTVQQLLTGAPKDAAPAADNAAVVAEFWADVNNCSMLFDVLSDIVTELETLYVPQEHGFRRRKKMLEAEDWNDLFEGLEVLIRNNVVLIHEGWKNQGFTLLFAKLLKRDNHALIKKYAFRCLALYTDATRNVQQLATLANREPSRGTVTAATPGGDLDLGAEDDDGLRSTATFGSIRRPTLHLELLKESVDFSPYGGGSIHLPDKFINQGVHVEGWIRSMPTQAEEPVDMLKYIMDLSLEREDAKILTNPSLNHKLRGDRFEYWADLIMRFYMPLLYPKVCLKVKLKEEGDVTGFFHHCPGSFQRVVARWIYKLRSKPECMETLWSRREFSEVIMETVRQRFAYRDNELVLDAIKFYSGICTGSQYVPLGMQGQIHETSRSMISHVSQLFHPSVQLDDAKILLNCIELLELIAQRQLDDYTSTYLRKFVISTIDNCTTLRDPNNVAILRAMVSVVLHVWMHAAIVSKSNGQQVWLELTIAIRRWLINPNDSLVIGPEVINCWKRELRFSSCVLMTLIDNGQSIVKFTSDGAIIVPLSSPTTEKDAPKDHGKQTNAHSATNVLIERIHEVSEATILLDRVLHLIPPPTMSSLQPILHLSLLEGMLPLVELWIDSAICSQRVTPTALHSISPSTVWALFGEWFVPACELESPEYQHSRNVAIVILCKLCSVRCSNALTDTHLSVLARVLFKGITSPSGVVVSTVLTRAASIFTLNMDGMNVLIPAFLYAVDQIIVQNIWERAAQSKVKSSEWNRELGAALDVIFSIFSLPKRFSGQDFVSWQQKIASALNGDYVVKIKELMEEVPDTSDSFHAIVGRVLVRIASLPFMDIVAIKKRALWGLYTLCVSHLEMDDNQELAMDRSLLTDWILKLVDFCYATDFSVCMTALSILQDLADFHSATSKLDSSLVARIVMTLAVFAQQQVEEASVEVQGAMENLADATIESGKYSSITGADSVSMTGSSRGSTIQRSRTSDVDNVGVDNTHKIKTSLKPSGAPVLAQPSPHSKNNEHELPALRLIVQKTGAIFECLRFWVMHRAEILQDDDVKKILFTAIEAAFVGTLPDGDWQREVERARKLERRNSMPLLFLGLQMRASLDNESSQSWLKCFEETSMAAEGLLMYLLHHINGFPSPAGVDRMVSSCTELPDEDDTSAADTASDSSTQSFSFVFMDSIIFTVVGSLESPSARFVARDMTGLFTWEILPAAGMRAISSTAHGERHSSDPSNEATSEDQRGLDRIDRLHLHKASSTARVELRYQTNEGSSKAGNVLCQVCGGEWSRPGTEVHEGAKLEVLQVPRRREEAILSNSVCSSKGGYVFHEDSDVASPAQNSAQGSGIDKKKQSTNPKGMDGEKMPSAEVGNKDDRVERLERIAKQYEERNNVGSFVPLSPRHVQSPLSRVCDCNRTPENSIAVWGLLEMDEREPNIGSLDDERCLLDLILDGIPMVFRDCGGDTTDKTVLGGRYAMNKYSLMELDRSSNPLTNDSAEVKGFSFLQRLIHDEECYSQLKAFLLKDGQTEGKELAEFCDVVKKFDRVLIPSERLGIACSIYWEYMSADGGRQIQFPSRVCKGIQDEIQKTQKALKLGHTDRWCLPGSLFQDAMTHIEMVYFEGAGLLDRYVASLEQPSPNGQDAKPNGSRDVAISPGTVLPQLSLFDAFSVAELNTRISHRALCLRDAEDGYSSLSTQPIERQGADLQQDSLRVTPLDVCRLFLSQSSLLSSPGGDASSRRRFKLLESGPKLERSLRHLDKSPTRETMKIGVIYVGPGQRTQQEILRNQSGSAAYNRFLAQIGWEVDLLRHRGFSGGLDCNPRSLSNGPTALYYANGHSEVMFHVVTKMPSKPSDPQQIDKKRHVGNDYVHIVWSENDTHDYDPSTITSHFNDVQIVIYPLRRSQIGLYLIKIFSKEKVPPFGPMQSGMVLAEPDLVSLVRQTAMNANRVCRSQTSIYVRPYPTRKKLVEEIVERYASEYQESELLTMLFAQSATSGQQQYLSPAPLSSS